MRGVKFIVKGELPPKKDGANSMWGKPLEAQRLIALRTEARRALRNQPPFEREIRVELIVVVGDGEQAGDLDNYISGVCDGLQTADSQACLHSLFQEARHAAINPRRWAAITDDARIVEIRAEKRQGSDPSEYRLRIAGH